jgi:hypothetical protein
MLHRLTARRMDSDRAISRHRLLDRATGPTALESRRCTDIGSSRNRELK